MASLWDNIKYNTSTQTADNTKNKAVKKPLVYNLENLNKIPEPVVIPPINGLSNTLYNQSTIPTNMSTPILDITPQRNASRMQSKTVTPTVTTPVAPKASVKQSMPVEEVSLASVVKPLARRNGGFDEYRRQSALAALRNAGGISPAEGVQ